MKRTVNFFFFSSSILLASSLPIEDENYEFLKFNVNVASQKLFEGDIIINPDQEKSLFYPRKSGLSNEKYRWQNKTVPYKISSEFGKFKKKLINYLIFELN